MAEAVCSMVKPTGVQASTAEMMMSVKLVCLRSLTILSNFMCKEFSTYTGKISDIKSTSMLNFNKVDVNDETTQKIVQELSDLYEGIGYQCLSISAKTGENIEAVKTLMIGKSSMFAGHSGVGKSTLINSIEPGLNIKTKEISEQHKQGQHTTTFAEMFDLSFDARIIDTPGIKGFGVVDMEPAEVDNYFPELFALKQSCKFNNCLHLHEPQCAVKLALEQNQIAPSRYKSYTQILEGDDEHYRSDVYNDDRIASDETRK